jgi:hypothetical protein
LGPERRRARARRQKAAGSLPFKPFFFSGMQFERREGFGKDLQVGFKHFENRILSQPIYRGLQIL